jgi:hypothetical protein
VRKNEKKDKKYNSLSGTYNSWDTHNWNDLNTILEVKQVEKTITVWESI